MEIALTAKGLGLGAWLDPELATCGHIMIVDDRDRFRSWPNAFGGAELENDVVLAQRLVESGVDALVTGTLSAEAYAVLRADAGRPVVTSYASIEEAVKAYLAGSLEDHTEKLH